MDLLCELDPPFIKGFISKKYPDYCRNIQNEKRRVLEETLGAGRKLLLDAGFKAESISTKIEVMKFDVALTIIEEARTGYDLIVLGRRGYSGLKKFIQGLGPFQDILCPGELFFGKSDLGLGFLEFIGIFAFFNLGPFGN